MKDVHSRLTLVFRFDTPAFLHGADGKTAEFRFFSFKGALRYWLRAVLWRHYENKELEPDAIPPAVRRKEMMMMGSTEMASRIRLVRQKVTSGALTLSKHSSSNEDVGLGYLAGQGVHHFKNCWQVDYLKAGTQVELELYIVGYSDEERMILQKALLAFFLFGGLGQRSRRGFGSCTPVAIEGLDLRFPENAESLRQVVRTFSGDFTWYDTDDETGLENLPPYPAFSRYTLTAMRVCPEGDAVGCLENLGKDMLKFRSNRRNRRLFDGTRPSGNFIDDKKLILSFLNKQRIDRPPRRIVFGAPHNYYFSSKSMRCQINVARRERDNKILEKRRGSPLFLSVHRLKDGTHAVVGLLLPARFMRDEDGILIKQGGVRQWIKDVPWQKAEFWLPAIEFLETLRDVR